VGSRAHDIQSRLPRTGRHGRAGSTSHLTALIVTLTLIALPFIMAGVLALLGKL
jgi:hypothetical protein